MQESTNTKLKLVKKLLGST